MSKIIFLGNGPLAEATLETLQEGGAEILMHARRAEDLVEVCELKRQHPEAHAVLASFGVIIKPEVLEVFEPEGILNLHPSLLPKYRGPAPIESAILDGATDFGVSIMKLAETMDAGPVYWQSELSLTKDVSKAEIYEKLARAGAKWLLENLENLPVATEQDETQATYTQKLNTGMAEFLPAEKTAEQLLREVRAFYKFPKSRINIGGLDCIVLEAHVADEAPGGKLEKLALKCADGKYLIIDKLQPAGKKPMDAAAFANGYLK